jgi:DNA (cytosine-5)-methyltransferase 1
MENVTNLKGVGGGLLYHHILERIHTVGYNVSVEALLAADFGAPQLRRRLIFLGCRKDIGTLSFPPPTHSEQGTLFSQPYTTVRQAFAGLPHAQFTSQHADSERPHRTLPVDSTL